MVRQPYMTRLALGRSAYEPPEWPENEKSQDVPASEPGYIRRGQQETTAGKSDEYVQCYDTRGHPENRGSRSHARRSRRAQNDILTTVGVCVSVDKNGQLVPASSVGAVKEQLEMKGVLSVVTENEFGFWLGAAEVAFTALSASCITGLRLRLETLSIFSHIPIREIIIVEWRRFGYLKWLFAGVPAAFAFELLDAGRSVAIEETRDALLNRLGTSNLPERLRRWAERFIYAVEQLLDAASLVAISPLQLFSMLQQLDLLPAWPLVPSPLKLSVASLSPLLFPPIPQAWTLHSSLSYGIGICLSPLPVFLGFRYVANHLDTHLLRYTRLLLLRPDCPDDCSLKAYTEQPNTVVGLTMDHIKHKTSFTDEITKDFLTLIDLITDLRVRLRKILPALPRPAVIGDPSDFTIQDMIGEDAPYLAQLAYPHNDPYNTPSNPSPRSPELITELPTNRETSTTPPPTSLPVTPSNHRAFHSPSTAPSSPLLSASTDSEEYLLRTLEAANPVQITTRTGSTDTLHMNVEVNGTDPGAPVFTSSFSASPRAALVETLEVRRVLETQHRVTALTLHASDSLAQHLVDGVVTVLRLPLEAFLARSVAHAFLTRGALAPSSGTSAAVSAMSGLVFPRNAWFGAGLQAGGWVGVGDYARKMALCVGLESVVGFCVWQAGFEIAWWAGRRWFLWGRL